MVRLPRSLAYVCGAIVAARCGGVTHDEAMCILADSHVVFFGDSLTRFCYHGLVAWLKTGALRPYEFSSKWGEPGLDYDCCEDQTWTEDRQDCGAGGAHRMYVYGDVPDYGIATSYYFIASSWFEDLADLSETLTADTIVFNMGWWQLKDCGSEARPEYCGERWNDACEEAYAADLQAAVDGLFSKASLAVYRTTACCGEEEDAWIPGIEAQNAVAKAVMAANGVPVVDIYDLYGWDDIDEFTFDGKHADVATCPLWYDRILETIDAERGLNCIGNAANYAFTPDPGWEFSPPPERPRASTSPSPRGIPTDSGYGST